MGMKQRPVHTLRKRKRLKNKRQTSKKIFTFTFAFTWSEHSLKVQIHLFEKKRTMLFLGKNILKNFILICFDLQGNRCNINVDAILS